MNCLIIYNPYSGRKKSSKYIINIQNKLKTIYQKVDIFISSKKDSIRNKISSINNEYQILFVLGGDGTLHEVINAIIDFKKQDLLSIYYFPCGTLNDFAHSMHLKVNLNKAIKILKENNIKNYNVVKLNNKHFLYGSAFGKFSSVSYDINNSYKKFFRSFAYYLKIIKNFFKKENSQYKITFSDKEFIINNYVTFFLNTLKMGGFTMHYKNNIYFDDTEFKIVIIKKSIFSIFNFVLFFLFGEYYHNKNILNLNTNKANIKINKIVKINGDGELLTITDNIFLSINNNEYIKFFLPKKMNKYFKQ